MAARYVCLDFETNGFRSAEGAPRCEWTLPYANCLIQFSVDSVEDGVVWHALDTCIGGATQLAPWVRENVPITLQDVQQGRTVRQVVQDLTALLQDGDTIKAFWKMGEAL